MEESNVIDHDSFARSGLRRDSLLDINQDSITCRISAHNVGPPYVPEALPTVESYELFTHGVFTKSLRNPLCGKIKNVKVSQKLTI